MKEGQIINNTKKVLVLLGVVVFLLPSFSEAATLSELLRRQRELQRQSELNKQKLDQTRREARSLSEAIGDIESDINYTQNRINNTGERISATNQIIDELSKDIKLKEADISVLTKQNNNAYVLLYELSQTSTIEQVLTGNSINDVLSQAQFIQSIQTDLQADILEVNRLKDELSKQKSEAESQKTNLSELNSDLKQSQSSLLGQRTQKTYLLSVTKNNEATYQNLINKIKQEADFISEEIYQKRQSLGDSLPGVDTYPYKNYKPNTPDPWGFLMRQCTSYPAYRVDGLWYRNPLPPGVPRGHAMYWPAMARYRGVPTGSVPRKGAFIVWGEPGKYVNYNYISSLGHVAFVERVHSRTDIEVSDYNWKKYAYSYRRINPTKFGSPTYIYIK
ncbi:CHAP domain-containing protein [Candidatus Berkelbacteria bacterium]|nr:CHAP domain-containing protein [Candidatus Berkelbacteria bacterium]